MQRSWSWLAARLSPRRIWGSTNVLPHRPCLASVERLGDRILLSSSEPTITGDSAILAAVIKGELPLVTEELRLLNTVGDGLTNKTRGNFEKLVHAFLDVNDTINTAASDIFGKHADIKGESGDHKHKDEIEILSVEFKKIDEAFKALGVGGVENQSPAADFEQQAKTLLMDIQGARGGDLDKKAEILYARILDGFFTLDQTIIKAQSDLITVRKAGKEQQEFLKIKLQDVLVSSINQATDPQLDKAALLGAEAQTAGILIGLLKPGPGTSTDGAGNVQV
jgi:type VI protein secretion system component Hcp